MAPPCHSFSASELPARVQQDGTGRRRKLENGTQRIDLAQCELFRMMQYNCDVQEPVTPSSVVRCYPIERLFRK